MGTAQALSQCREEGPAQGVPQRLQGGGAGRPGRSLHQLSGPSQPHLLPRLSGEAQGPGQGLGVRLSSLAQQSGLGGCSWGEGRLGGRQELSLQVRAGGVRGWGRGVAAAVCWLLSAKSGHRLGSGLRPAWALVGQLLGRCIARVPSPRQGRPLLALGEAGPERCCFHGGRSIFYLFNPSHSVNYSFTFM